LAQIVAIAAEAADKEMPRRLDSPVDVEALKLACESRDFRAVVSYSRFQYLDGDGEAMPQFGWVIQTKNISENQSFPLSIMPLRPASFV
jgi:hypothetical protein